METYGRSRKILTRHFAILRFFSGRFAASNTLQGTLYLEKSRMSSTACVVRGHDAIVWRWRDKAGAASHSSRVLNQKHHHTACTLKQEHQWEQSGYRPRLHTLTFRLDRGRARLSDASDRISALAGKQAQSMALQTKTGPHGVHAGL